MTEEVPLKERLKEARLRTGAERRETVSQAKMADLVSGLVGRPIYQSTWSEYESGSSEPPLDVFRAVARLSKLSFLYLTLGGAEDEIINPQLDHKLTAEEEERATRAAERARKAKSRQGKGRRAK